MSETRDRIAEVVRDIAEAYTDQMPPDDDELAPYVERLAAIQEGESAEPVAWKVKSGEYVELWTARREVSAREQVESLRKGYPEKATTLVPLYTHPAPPSGEPRAIKDLSHLIEINDGMDDDDVVLDSPSAHSQRIAELKARGWKRVNAPDSGEEETDGK